MMVQGTGRNRVYRSGCEISAWAQSVSLESVPAREYWLAERGKPRFWRSWDAQRRKMSPHGSAYFFLHPVLTTQWEREGEGVGWFSGLLGPQGGVYSTGKSCRRPGQGQAGGNPGRTEGCRHSLEHLSELRIPSTELFFVRSHS